MPNSRSYITPAAMTKMQMNSEATPMSCTVIESDLNKPNNTESGARSRKRRRRTIRSRRRNRGIGDILSTRPKTANTGGIVAAVSKTVKGFVQKENLNSATHARSMSSKKNSAL
mmetsp:Transcript_9356/g.27027  ORF Transcript_9356/g.27027 Transcript_9356/m.27027 type:complete len:114 (-) Transcript_9356:905-1246(-)